jgi:uncharacterized alpha-E superfamily protein
LTDQASYEQCVDLLWPIALAAGSRCESTQELCADNRQEFYRDIRKSTQLTLGLVRSTMLHDEPISFLWLRVMLERVGQTARIVDMHHHTLEQESAHDILKAALWMSLLRACFGAEGFMKKHQRRVTAQTMVASLLFEPAFPQSLRYCLRSGQGLLERIWGQPHPHGFRARRLEDWSTCRVGR